MKLSGRINGTGILPAIIVATLLVQFPTPAQQGTANDWDTVAKAIGKVGTMQSGDVYKIGFPRSDLHVSARGVQIKAAFALGSWVAFKKMEGATIVMGDLVLLEDEVPLVMTRLQQGGVEQTALHNHVLGESPRIMYMHISAMGDGVKIAQTIHDALALSKTPFGAPPSASASDSELGIDPKQIDQIMGQKGKVNSGVYQYSIPRDETITEGTGMVIPPSMGVAQAINFQPTGGGKAAITGDFVLTASEVNSVIRALRDNAIEVTAVHSHMLTESPRLFFMHFWANDDSLKLARGLRTALNSVKIARIPPQ